MFQTDKGGNSIHLFKTNRPAATAIHVSVTEMIERYFSLHFVICAVNITVLDKGFGGALGWLVR
jgi:hypothetical protein